MTGFRRTILMVAVAALGITGARASEPCLNDTSDKQRVTGTLSIHIFAADQTIAAHHRIIHGHHTYTDRLKVMIENSLNSVNCDES